MTDNQEKLVEQYRWVLEIGAQAGPSYEKWENTVQTIALWQIVNPYMQMSPNDMLVIGCAGWLISTARLVDEEKFSDIAPVIYFQAAFMMVNPEHEEGDWVKFYKSITKTNINTL